MIVSRLRRNRVRKLTLVNGVFLLLGVLLLTGMGGCGESPPDLTANIRGRWTGTFESEGNKVKVTLTVNKDDAGELNRGHLDFSTPWSGTIDAEFIETVNAVHEFRFIKTSATGPKCEQLGAGKMTLKPEGKNWQMDVTSEDDKTKFTAVLHAAGG